MHARLRILLALVSGLLLASGATGGEVRDLPPALRGRVSIEVTSCRPYAGSRNLMQAEIRIRTGGSPVRLPDLQCGAFEPGTDRPLFLNPVDGVRSLAAGTERVVKTVFPFDPRHTECRCVVANVTRIAPSPSWREAPVARPPRLPGERTPAQPEGPNAPVRVLRRELVLLPSVDVHSGPGVEHAVVGQVGGSELVEVIAVEGGWKWIRLSARGVEGWIPDDAATPDVEAPARVARVLDRLGTHGDSGSAGSTQADALCQSGSIAELGDLVFALRPEAHAAYVTNLWHTLSPRRRDALQRYLSACFGVTRIVAMASGETLHDFGRSDGPGAAELRRADEPD